MAMLEVNDIKVYYGMIQAIKGVSFHVDEGEVIALIGANGAGKTTILHTVSGLLTPKEGSITLKVRIWLRSPDTRSYPWVWRMYRREDEYLHSFPYYRI